MKYAIVEHSGRQYLAQEGGLIEVDRMSLEVGKPVVFKDVLFITDGTKTEVGAPFVKGASVKGKVENHPKGKKITVFKYKPKQRYRRKQGHRQLLTHVSIESIGLPKAKEADAKSKAKAAGSSQKKESGTSSKKSSGAAKKQSSSTSKKGAAGTSKSKSAGTSKQGSSKKSKPTKKD